MKRTLEHSKKPTDIHQHLVSLHNLAIGLKAKLVVELGVNTGQSTVALLEAVHATDGHLISVDPLDYKDTKAMIEGYGLASRWTYVLDDDIQFAGKWDRGPVADLVFIDTTHQYDQTRKELEVFDPIVRRGGILVLHDTTSYPDGVFRALKEFLAAHPDYRFDHYTNCNGLGIVRKPA